MQNILVGITGWGEQGRSFPFLWLPECWLALSRKRKEKKKEKENYRAAQKQKQEEKIEINTRVKKWSMCVIFIMNT